MGYREIYWVFEMKGALLLKKASEPVNDMLNNIFVWRKAPSIETLIFQGTCYWEGFQNSEFNLQSLLVVKRKHHPLIKSGREEKKRVALL